VQKVRLKCSINHIMQTGLSNYARTAGTHSHSTEVTQKFRLYTCGYSKR